MQSDLNFSKDYHNVLSFIEKFNPVEGCYSLRFEEFLDINIQITKDLKDKIPTQSHSIKFCYTSSSSVLTN